MAEEFNISWINVLDESMMEWFNKYVPGFMCVGHKPQPFGNKRNTIFLWFNFYFMEITDSGRKRSL